MIKNWLYFTLLVLMPVLLFANEEQNDRELAINFAKWKILFQTQALEQGISSIIINNVMPKVKYLPEVVELDRNQPFTKMTFIEYQQKIISSKRIAKARKLYTKHNELLRQVAKEYGVQPRFIVALWGIESSFGQNMGNFLVIDSLATLAFDGRRREFFTKELIYAFKILEQSHISYDKMKGSWAGAMGQTQFMPSSFHSYAVDMNYDNAKDIWQTKHDIFASIANYLKSAGWNPHITWGRKVMLTRDIPEELLGIKKKISLATWKELGVLKESGEELPNVNIKASLILHNDSKEQAYLVYANYDALLRWNRSLYFASSVGILSDAIIRK